MRLVLDTNVVISRLLWDGVPARLLDAAEADRIELFTTRTLLAELTRVLRRAKFVRPIASSGLSIEQLVLGYAALAVPVEAAPITPTIIADPDDDHILACAVTAKADIIASGDDHLLSLKEFGNISIVSAAEALQRVSTL